MSSRHSGGFKQKVGIGRKAGATVNVAKPTKYTSKGSTCHCSTARHKNCVKVCPSLRGNHNQYVLSMPSPPLSLVRGIQDRVRTFCPTLVVRFVPECTWLQYTHFRKRFKFAQMSVCVLAVCTSVNLPKGDFADRTIGRIVRAFPRQGIHLPQPTQACVRRDTRLRAG